MSDKLANQKKLENTNADLKRDITALKTDIEWIKRILVAMAMAFLLLFLNLFYN